MEQVGGEMDAVGVRILLYLSLRRVDRYFKCRIVIWHSVLIAQDPSGMEAFP
jgi:hypothetical protein